MKYLVVVAHPDDEVLGAGATIHKLVSEGHKVAVAIMVSQAEARKDLSSSLSSDEHEALSIIGVEKIYHASFPNIEMNVVPHLSLLSIVLKIGVLKLLLRIILQIQTMIMFRLHMQFKLRADCFKEEKIFRY